MTRPAIPRSALVKFLDAIREGGTVSEACDAAAICTRTAYRYRDDDPEFAAAWIAAKEVAIDLLEKELTVRARDRSDPYSAGLLKFALAGYRRQTFGQHVRVEAKVEATNVHSVRAAAQADPEAFERMSRLLAEQSEDAA